MPGRNVAFSFRIIGSMWTIIVFHMQIHLWLLYIHRCVCVLCLIPFSPLLCHRNRVAGILLSLVLCYCVLFFFSALNLRENFIVLEIWLKCSKCDVVLFSVLFSSVQLDYVHLSICGCLWIAIFEMSLFASMRNSLGNPTFR